MTLSNVSNLQVKKPNENQQSKTNGSLKIDSGAPQESIFTMVKMTVQNTAIEASSIKINKVVNAAVNNVEKIAEKPENEQISDFTDFVKSKVKEFISAIVQKLVDQSFQKTNDKTKKDDKPKDKQKPNEITFSGNNATVKGTPGNDIITVTGNNLKVDAEKGNDKVIAKGNNITIINGEQVNATGNHITVINGDGKVKGKGNHLTVKCNREVNAAKAKFEKTI